MNFQKKSKPTASVAGRPSPKTLRKNKSTRSTKSEAQVPAEDSENNNSTESLEQQLKDKLDLESKSGGDLGDGVGRGWVCWCGQTSLADLQLASCTQLAS